MNKTALLIIDVQKGFNDPSWGSRNNLEAESNIALLLAKWRNHNLPVIHVQHCSLLPTSVLHPTNAGHQLKDEVKPLPHETLFTKTTNSAFIGTKLEQHLHENMISDIIITGLITDHCVSTTARMAGNLGFNVILVADATATFERLSYDGTRYSAEEMHQINLASLHNEFCTVYSTKDVLSLIS